MVKEHDTMLHVDGTILHHKFSRKYYWPNMINEIKTICKAYANLVRQLKSDDNICLLLLNKQKKRTFLCMT